MGGPGLVVLAALILGPAAAQAELIAGPRVAELRYGLVCPMEDVLVTSEGAEDTVTGEINLLPGLPKIIAEGPVIPAVLGYSMSLQGMLRPGETVGDVRVITEHPPMGPDGITRQSTVSRLETFGPFHRGYGFDLPVEMVPGPWSITILAGQEVIAAARFTVVPPAARPDLVGLCTGELIS